MSATSLAPVFLAAGPLSGWVSVAELERLLGEIVAEARTVWPGVCVPPEVFLAHLRQHVPLGEPVEQALRKMKTADLYLACACGLGDPRALVAFDAAVLSVVDEVAAQQRLGATAGGEMKQEIRARVLVADGGPPRITRFSGRGELRGWVRVIATRTSSSATRRCSSP
jgi:RNA polymerase sigma-70 factor (ECF subfamily)